MFAPTSNSYRFRYLITGISGPGIPCVYLPEPPPDDQVLFKKEQKWTRPAMPPNLEAWAQEMLYEREKKPDYVHSHQIEINAWEEQEAERCEKGVWFWNDGEKTYITGPNYKYLTHWKLYFGYPDYWDSDREVFYWQGYWEEDPESCGGCLNTLRRGGKSARMGFWLLDRTSTNFDHFGGMQGEDDTKIGAFYDTFVLKPFKKTPYFLQPQYDTTTLQKKGISFIEPPRRKKKSTQLVLDSQLDYRTSEDNKYDQAVLHSYVMEEPGKTKKVNVSDRWDFVKPCLMDGTFIRGKAYLGTTVEYLNLKSKGGKAYKKICLNSDFNHKGEDGRTTSGLYAALMPADCCLKGMIDAHGRPMRAKAIAWIMMQRKKVENNPKDYSSLIRKYPLNWAEVFYINTENCEYNSKILQDRKAELLINPVPIRRFDCKWENDKRFTKIILIDNPITGWLKTTSLMDKERYNDVGQRVEGDKTFYFPKNDMVFRLALDPIDHGVVVEDVQDGEDFISSRRSRPVLLGKRMYDSDLEGVLTQELLEQRAREKYPYKTGKQFLMMDHRPSDPNVLFERVLMVCWLLSCKVHVEGQNPGTKNWIKGANCGDFLWQKYVGEGTVPKPADLTEGTPASTMVIQDGISATSTDVEYFGHTYPFVEVIDDDLQYDPANRREFDYAVCHNLLDLACKMKPLRQPQKVVDISQFMPMFDAQGNIIKNSVQYN